MWKSEYRIEILDGPLIKHPQPPARRSALGKMAKLSDPST